MAQEALDQAPTILRVLKKLSGYHCETCKQTGHHRGTCPTNLGMFYELKAYALGHAIWNLFKKSKGNAEGKLKF